MKNWSFVLGAFVCVLSVTFAASCVYRAQKNSADDKNKTESAELNSPPIDESAISLVPSSFEKAAKAVQPHEVGRGVYGLISHSGQRGGPLLVLAGFPDLVVLHYIERDKFEALYEQVYLCRTSTEFWSYTSGVSPLIPTISWARMVRDKLYADNPLMVEYFDNLTKHGGLGISIIPDLPDGEYYVLDAYFGPEGEYSFFWPLKASFWDDYSVPEDVHPDDEGTPDDIELSKVLLTISGSVLDIENGEN